MPMSCFFFLGFHIFCVVNYMNLVPNSYVLFNVTLLKLNFMKCITYLPHKAVAEVSKDKEPIGRGCVEFKWLESQLMSDSSELNVKWFGCQSISDSNDLVVNRCVLQMILVLLQKWSFEAQNQSFCARLFLQTWSFEAQNQSFCARLFLQTWSFEAQNQSFCARLPSKMKAQNQSFCARLPSKMKLWSSKPKLLCETSFKHEALKLKTDAFVRDFLQKWSLKLKNEAFVRDFRQKWHVDQTLDFKIPIRFSDFWANASKVLRLPRKTRAEAYEAL